MFAVFDLDGTLLDTLNDIADSVNAVLRARSLPEHSYDDYRVFIGEGLKVLLQRAFPNSSEHQSEEALQKFIHETREVYGKNLIRLTRPYPGIKKLLKDLENHNVKLAILSNKPDDMTKKLADHFFSDISFVTVMGASEKFPRKPDAASLNYIIEKIGEPLQNGYFIGDTITDIKTAERSGLKSIGVDWGFRPDETKAADFRVKDASEIGRIILRT